MSKSIMPIFDPSRSVQTTTWDPSVLGITLHEWARMDADERQKYMVSALNKAADLIEATANAFDMELGSDRSELKRLAVKLSLMARKFR